MSVPGPQSRGANGVARSDSKISAKALYEQRKKYSNSNFIMHETSQYHVEHLTTFIMDKKESIVTVDDAVKKLVLLDSKRKIWTQEMLLQVTDKAVCLLDCDTQEELENFPLHTIQMSQAVLNQTQYPSVLLLVCQDKEQHKPDVHFFHCDEVEAEMVHADIDSAIGDNKHGKKMRLQTLKVNQEKMKRHRETILPTSPPQGLSYPPKGRVAAPDTQERGAAGQTDSESLAKRTLKEVEILNCALDDIENFVARLQKAAEAFSQLNHRNKSKKNKKKGPAEGMLTLRAKPPTEAEFIDSLKKLKLALNLVAKVKKHIQNPSAAELVHFLFGPLELVLQSCGSPELVRSIISPHLSRETVDFLRGHLIPKEMTIFELLGDGWTKPRAEWPRDQCAPVYYPKFRNGWEPPAELFRTAPWETEGPTGPLGSPTSPNYRKHSAEDYYGTHSSGSSDGSYNGKTQPRKYAKIHYHFVARNANELSVLQDEILEVLEDDRQWWKLRNRSGQTGYVPFNILNVVKIEESEGSYSQDYRKSPPGTLGHGDVFSNGIPKDKMDKVNSELLKKITENKGPPVRKIRVERPSNNCLPLTFDSSPEQVTTWLKAQGFSSSTVECLGILTGPQLFSLNKDELRAVCGDEGGRVYNQVSVDKKKQELRHCCFCTRGSISSQISPALIDPLVQERQGEPELLEIMRQQQQRINSSSTN